VIYFLVRLVAPSFGLGDRSFAGGASG